MAPLERISSSKGLNCLENHREGTWLVMSIRRRRLLLQGLLLGTGEGGKQGASGWTPSPILQGRPAALHLLVSTGTDSHLRDGEGGTGSQATHVLPALNEEVPEGRGVCVGDLSVGLSGMFCCPPRLDCRD